MTINARNSNRTLEDGAFDFLRRIEQPRGNYIAQIHNDGDGIPTAGYGYALVVQSGGVWQRTESLEDDFQQVGLILTPADILLLRQMATNLNTNAGTANVVNNVLIQELAGNVGQILAVPTGRQLFDLEVGRAETTLINRFTAVLGNRPTIALNRSLAGSYEKEALVSLAYNGAATLGGNLLVALASGNRAEAWYQIRYGTNGDASFGIAKRRFVEAQLFGLYHDENAPTAAESQDAMRMLTRHRTKIITYEQRYGAPPYGGHSAGGRDMIDADPSAANQTFGAEPLYQVDTLTESLIFARNAFVTWLNGSGQLAGQGTIVAADFQPAAIYFDPDSPLLDARNLVAAGYDNNLLVGRTDRKNQRRRAAAQGSHHRGRGDARGGTVGRGAEGSDAGSRGARSQQGHRLRARRPVGDGESGVIPIHALRRAGGYGEQREHGRDRG